MEEKLKSISFFDDRYPVRTVCTDNSDWQRHAGWQHADTRNAWLKDYLRVPLERFVYAREIHSGNVLAISGGGDGDGLVETVEEADTPGLTGGYDAMATSVPGIMLCIWTADCLPLYLYEPGSHVAAIAHCGWRSICRGIASNTVGVMANRFGANPENIIAAFGPGICATCYEVGGELVEAFSERFPANELESLFSPRENGKYLLDLRKSIALELCRMGVQTENLHDMGICSYESEQYSSYRRNGPSELGTQTLSGIVLT